MGNSPDKSSKIPSVTRVKSPANIQKSSILVKSTQLGTYELSFRFSLRETGRLRLHLAKLEIASDFPAGSHLLTYKLEELPTKLSLTTATGKHSTYLTTEPQLQVVKQTVSIGTELYVLEDLYGEEKQCVICLSQEKEVLVLPCKHVCVCKDCAGALGVKGAGKCPVCRTPIEGIYKTGPIFR